MECQILRVVLPSLSMVQEPLDFDVICVAHRIKYARRGLRQDYRFVILVLLTVGELAISRQPESYMESTSQIFLPCYFSRSLITLLGRVRSPILILFFQSVYGIVLQALQPGSVSAIEIAKQDLCSYLARLPAGKRSCPLNNATAATIPVTEFNS